jgi:tetratricopeptide (TPR) repeat protein
MNPRRALVVVLALTACQPPAARSTALLQDASRRVAAGPVDARTLALAGFEAYLLAGDMTRAQARFDAALHEDPVEPYALYGQLLLARRRGHPESALAAALALCERAPLHPLASSAARFVLDVSGQATALDDSILERAPKALARGLPGDGAHLLRSAVATIQGQRSATAAQTATLADMGIPDAYALVGPFSAYHVLSFDNPLPSESDGSWAGPFPGLFGSLTPRTLRYPDGRFTLAGSGSRGDLYLVGVDVDVPKRAEYIVRAVSSSSFKLQLDRRPLLERRGFERASPTVSAAGVSLGAGHHRVTVKLAKAEGSGGLSLSLMRADGAPAGLTFRPASGPAPAYGSSSIEPLETAYPDAKSFADALAPEAGDVLSRYLAARDGLGRDRDGVKALVDDLPPDLESPAVSELKADVSLADRGIPTKVAHGRATRDLEATVEKDHGNVDALLALTNLALEENRPLAASELAQQARAAQRAVGYPVALMQARVALALGSEAQADQAASEALRLQPGLCEAGSLRYDLARKRDDARMADQWVQALASCPGAQSRLAEHAKMRGRVDEAVHLYEGLLARDPAHVPAATALADLYVSRRKFEAAAQLLAGMTELWPYNTEVLKREADVFEFWGNTQRALELRERSLAIDGGDLTLRRLVERAHTHQEPLEAQSVTTKTAIAAYEAQRGDESAASAYVLDFAATQVYPDGSMVDRIHVIQKALDQNGVQEIAEVNVPAGAQVLALRTLKPDGTTLEPESVEDKDTISMPGVAVGDYVDQEYLEAHPARDPSQPGFTAANFYFQVAQSPNNWSTYTVLAPKGSGMSVDAHNMTSSAPVTHGDWETYEHAERHVPPFIPEPNSPPSPNEFLPFVSVGAGATGNDTVMASYADAALDRGQLTHEVEVFARRATAGKKGVAAVRSLYDAVMQKLQGRDAGLGMSAAASVAQDRGSRLWLLKAGLEAAGFPSRVAAVRAFGVDPALYRFPNEQLVQYVCVRTVLSDGSVVWLDPLIRFAPFGQLPEQATGGRDAFLLPEPGRPLEKLKTPAAAPELGKQVTLTLKLGADGSLSGTGEETYLGIEAAQLAEALDQLAPEAREQALQRALSRYFGGADLSSVTLGVKREVGAPVSVRYGFTAPRYGHLEGDKLVLGPVTYPLQLGQRYIQVGSRRTPLFIEGTEAVKTTVTLELPPGFHLVSPVAEVKSSGPYGGFVRHERQEGNRVLVDEQFRLGMARIPVDKYEDFQQFAGEIDLVQGRDLQVEKKP